MKFFQQGDVVIKVISDFPKGERVQDEQMKSKTLAYGEVTGHAHRLLYEHNNSVETFRILNTIFMNVTAPVLLRHEEHNEIKIPIGKYKIDIVRETDHMTGVIREVAD